MSVQQSKMSRGNRVGTANLYFPRVRDGVTFHLSPSECMVFSTQQKAGSGSDSTPHRPRIKALVGMDVVNLDAFEVLSLCDGTRSETEILCELGVGAGSAHPGRSPRARAVVALVEQANQRGHLDLLPCPQTYPRRSVVTGSTDFFVPIHTSLELTHRCNLQCPYCYISAGQISDTDELTGSRILDILSDWIEYGLRGIELTGGEPLLHQDFWQILEYCLERLPSIALLSNGTLVDARAIDRLAEYKEQLTISLSLDGSAPDTHDKITGGRGSFEKTLGAARRLIQKGLRVRIAMTLTPDNWKEIEPTLLLAKSIGARWFGWAPAMPFGRGCGVEWDLTAEEMEELASKEMELLKSHQGFVPVIPKVANYLPDSWNCGIGWKNVVMGPSGLVRPCLLLPESSCAIGDLKTESIREAFDKDIILGLRGLPLPSDELCGECNLQAYCTSCPVRAMTKGETSDHCSWAEASGADELMNSMRTLAKTYQDRGH